MITHPRGRPDVHKGGVYSKMQPEKHTRQQNIKLWGTAL